MIPKSGHQFSEKIMLQEEVRPSNLRLGLEHLPAAIHAGLEIDVMGPPQLAGVLVLDVSRRLQRVGRTPHAASRRRGFSFRDGHGQSPTKPRGTALVRRVTIGGKPRL